MARLVAVGDEGPRAERLAAAPRRSAPPSLRWLGQAGFVLDVAGLRIVFDPYLSDSLADKYRGGVFPHERMMPPPVAAAAIAAVDLVLVTHHHTDHMDPQTLRPLLAATPDARLVAPAASVGEALSRAAVEPRRVVGLDAGDHLELAAGARVTATRAAHETLERDADGRHRFLGYLVDAGGVRVWHSGDCVPFDGLVDEVSALRPDVALLPVNGRRPDLAARGIAGNFSLDEAVDIARRIGVAAVVAHHFGLFAFNTADPAAIDARAATEAADGLQLVRPAVGIDYRWLAAAPAVPP